jgi:hypothetical protein
MNRGDISVREISDTPGVLTAFSKGEIGVWNNQLYVSTQYANIWTPKTDPHCWEKIEIEIIAI